MMDFRSQASGFRHTHTHTHTHARARARVCVCVCVCVCGLPVTQHGKRMRRIILSPVDRLALPYFSTLSHKRRNFRKIY